MSIGDDIAAALPELRAQAESMMRSTVTVRRKTGETRDPETGTNVPTWAVIYDGKARVRLSKAQGRARELDQAGQRLIETSPTLSLPMSDPASAMVRLDDVLTVTANDADSMVVGMVLRIIEPTDQTWSTARRFTVETITPA